MMCREWFAKSSSSNSAGEVSWWGGSSCLPFHSFTGNRSLVSCVGAQQRRSHPCEPPRPAANEPDRNSWARRLLAGTDQITRPWQQDSSCSQLSRAIAQLRCYSESCHARPSGTSRPWLALSCRRSVRSPKVENLRPRKRLAAPFACRSGPASGSSPRVAGFATAPEASMPVHSSHSFLHSAAR